MKKHKLKLRAETLRNLTTAQLGHVQGGEAYTTLCDTTRAEPSDACFCPGPSKVVNTEYITRVWAC